MKQIFLEIKEKKEQLECCAAAVDTLFLGSSHIAYDVLPSVFSASSFNLGSNSQDFFTSYSLYRYWEQRLPQLSNIYLGFSVFSAGANLARAGTLAAHICESYSFLYGFRYAPPNYEPDYVRRCVKLDKVKYARSNNQGYCRPAPIPPPPDGAEERARGHLKGYFREASQIFWAEKMAAHFRRTRGHVQFGLICCPVHPDYRSVCSALGYDASGPYALAERCHARILDFFADSSFTAKDFYDYDHLNCYGAEKFTRKLRECALKSKN